MLHSSIIDGGLIEMSVIDTRSGTKLANILAWHKSSAALA